MDQLIVLNGEEVFEADAGVVGEIDAGFDGEDHAFGEEVFGSGGESGGFVDLEADAVAEGVGDRGIVLAEDIVAGGFVGFGG